MEYTILCCSSCAVACKEGTLANPGSRPKYKTSLRYATSLLQILCFLIGSGLIPTCMRDANAQKARLFDELSVYLPPTCMWGIHRQRAVQKRRNNSEKGSS